MLLVPWRAGCLQVFVPPKDSIDELRSLISNEIPSPGCLGQKGKNSNLQILGPPWNKFDTPALTHTLIP